MTHLSYLQYFKEYITFLLLMFFLGLNSTLIAQELIGSAISTKDFVKFSKEKYEVATGQVLTICPDPISPKAMEKLKGESLEFITSNRNAEKFFPNLKKDSQVQFGNGSPCFETKIAKVNIKESEVFKFSAKNEKSEYRFYVVVRSLPKSEILHSNDLFVRAFDSSIDKYNSNQITIVNTHPIAPGTSFNLQQNTVNGLGVGYNIAYMGNDTLAESSSFCFFIYTHEGDTGYYFPGIDILLNGENANSIFSITNTYAGAPYGTLLNMQTTSVTITQGQYFNSASNNSLFFGTEINDLGGDIINTDSDHPMLNDFSGVFICGDQFYECDLQDMINLNLNWDITEGGIGINDIPNDICKQFCDIMDQDCESFDYEVGFEDCRILFSWYDCTIQSEDQIKVYYKEEDCNSGFEEFDELESSYYFIKGLDGDKGFGYIDLFNSVGCYKVEIQCEECPEPLVFQNFINECCPFNVGSEIKDATCADDGEITVNVEDVGTPPFQYLWNNGENTQSISNLPMGTYTVTITDSNGCTSVSDQNISTCCCAQYFDFNLTSNFVINDIKKGLEFLSEDPHFNFPYTDNSIDQLIYDFSIYELAWGGFLELSNNGLVINSCEDYDYIIGDLLDEINCPNGFITSSDGECSSDYIDNCNLELELDNLSNCVLQAWIFDISNYSVELQFFNEIESKWEFVSFVSSSQQFLNLMSGRYRLFASSSEGCPIITSCLVDVLCCNCEIEELVVTGDYLGDDRYCVGIDSLGFYGNVINCDEVSNIILTLPNGTTSNVSVDSNGYFSVAVTDSISLLDSGSYNFYASDYFGCEALDSIIVDVENCDLCSDCDIIYDVYSNNPSAISATEFDVNCGVLSKYIVSWYHNTISDSTKLFVSGSESYVLNHPFEDYPVLAGSIIPVIDSIVVDSILYTYDYPGTASCLDSVQVDFPSCEGGLILEYNYSQGEEFSDVEFEFLISDTTEYLDIKFWGYNVPDTLEVIYGNDIVYSVVNGNEVNAYDITTVPNLFDGSLVKYLLDVQSIHNGSDSILTFKVKANEINLITNWKIDLDCVSDFDCGTIGEADYTSVECENEEDLCRYKISYDYIGASYPVGLPSLTNASLSNKITRYLYYDVCDKIYFPNLYLDYCEQDSFNITRNGDIVTYSFYGDNGYYDELKSQVLNSFTGPYAADCDYLNSTDYYSYSALQSRNYLYCDLPIGDGQSNPSIYNYLLYRTCEDNFNFSDSEQKLYFTLEEIDNYANLESECLNCHNYIESNFVTLINNYYNNYSPDSTHYFNESKKYNYKFRPDVLDSTETRSKYIRHRYYSEELCETDCSSGYVAGSKYYQIAIDDWEDGCNNFSLYEKDICNGSAYELVYQVADGNTTTYSFSGIQEEFYETQQEDSNLNEFELRSDNEANYNFNLFPNPAINDITIEFISDVDDQGLLSIINSNGQVIKDESWVLIPGQNRLKISLKDSPPGLYVIHYESPLNTIFEKFILLNR